VGIHTITGAETGAGSGVQMFSFRQFSLPAVTLLPGGLTTGQGPGETLAFKVVAHGAAGCGGFQRKLPVGAAANGIPRKAHDEPLSTPCTAPLLVATRQDPVCGLASRGERTDAAKAATIVSIAIAKRLCMICLRWV
jgi:hypothetical protein